jgi:hypothetical protein
MIGWDDRLLARLTQPRCQRVFWDREVGRGAHRSKPKRVVHDYVDEPGWHSVHSIAFLASRKPTCRASTCGLMHNGAFGILSMKSLFTLVL